MLCTVVFHATMDLCMQVRHNIAQQLLRRNKHANMSLGTTHGYAGAADATTGRPEKIGMAALSPMAHMPGLVGSPLALRANNMKPLLPHPAPQEFFRIQYLQHVTIFTHSSKRSSRGRRDCHTPDRQCFMGNTVNRDVVGKSAAVERVSNHKHIVCAHSDAQQQRIVV